MAAVQRNHNRGAERTTLRVSGRHGTVRQKRDPVFLGRLAGSLATAIRKPAGVCDIGGKQRVATPNLVTKWTQKRS